MKSSLRTLRRLHAVSGLALLVALSAWADARAETVFRYSFTDETALPVIQDVSPAGRDAVAQALAVLSADVPTDGVPGDAGNRSLDSSDPNAVNGNESGAITNDVLLLSNLDIATAGGFTIECWFKWGGFGAVNSIIDYAGTEKIVIDQRAGETNLVEMRIAGTGDVPIGDAVVGQWHYVAAVFDTEGQPQNGDGTITGTLTTYFDSLTPATVRANATKDNFGDSLNRPIGIGQHPIGFDLDFFDGLVFEPRVSLGALAADELLYEGFVPNPPSTVFHYHFNDDTPFPDVPDTNDGTAGPLAALSDDIPADIPADGGNRSLDTSAMNAAMDMQSGVVTNATLLLSNEAIEGSAGFTMECWFKWLGGGAVNSILDYAGTEKIVIRDATTGQVTMRLNDGAIIIPIGTATAGTWHYVAVVFDTGRNLRNADGTITGTVRVYFDGTEAVSTTENVTKSSFGDSLDRSIGVGQHPIGFAADFFDGRVYEPKVSLGPLSASDLSFVLPLSPPATVFRYSFVADDPNYPTIFDEEGPGNDGTAGPLAVLSDDIPEVIPADGGNRSLDTSDVNAVRDMQSGVVTDATLLLSNEAIEGSGGFTMELWFQWLGAGDVNSIIDYAGTEKIVIRDATTGEVTIRLNDGGINIPIGTAIADTWHYVAVVFDTGRNLRNADGTITGTVRVYFDGTEAVSTTENVTKSNFGDSLDRSIGVGQHPLGFPRDFFDGRIFEPRVSLGPLSGDQLLFGVPEEVDRFVRGDSDSNGSINLTDGIVILNFLFLGVGAPNCLDAADSDDDGGANPTLTDAVIIFGWLFSGGPAPREPTPDAPIYAADRCGPDVTDDGMDCAILSPVCL